MTSECTRWIPPELYVDKTICCPSIKNQRKTKIRKWSKTSCLTCKTSFQFDHSVLTTTSSSNMTEQKSPTWISSKPWLPGSTLIALMSLSRTISWKKIHSNNTYSWAINTRRFSSVTSLNTSSQKDSSFKVKSLKSMLS